MSWEALEDLAAPPQLRGGALRWKPSVGTELGGGGGGTGASPPRPSPPPACPTPQSQAQEAQSSWPTSWARGRTFRGDSPARKVAGKLWLAAGLGDAQAVPARAPRAPQAPRSGAWPPFPPIPPTWAKLEMVPRALEAGGDRPHVPPRPLGSGEPFPPPPLSAPRAPPRTTHPAVDLGRPAASPWVRVAGARPAAPLYRPVGGQVD